MSDNSPSIEKVQDQLANATSMRLRIVHVPRMAAIGDLSDTKEPDLILLDIDPRESRGIDLLAEARGALPAVPIVAMSSVDDEQYATEALRSGADGFLTKDEISTRTLVTAIGLALSAQSTINLLTLAREREQHLATHDQLTGLPNRALAMERLSEAVASARHRDQKVAVLFLDLDGFRTINDTLGHAVGDGLLKGISRRLKSSLRKCDMAARLGGDKFAVILTELSSESDASRAAELILESLSEPIPIFRHPTRTTASIGIATFPKDAQDSDDLVKFADAALHHAKSLGVNRIECYAKSMQSATLRRLSIESALRVAIEEESFILHYQPQFDLRRGKIVGAEALLRWQHPDLGLVAPDRFLPVAEQTGLIVPIGEWVLREACQQARKWHEAGHRGLRISVNVASQQFQLPTFAATVRGVLDEFDFEPMLLELEITESSLLNDVEATANTLHELREMGVRLAIDDFGTGYSSLAYLKRLPIDVLKIDQSFVRNLVEDSDDATITMTIVNMAKGLGLSTTAEGVETFQQLLLLGSYGCHRMQGYLFGRPVEPEAFLSWLKDPPFSWSNETSRTDGNSDN